MIVQAVRSKEDTRYVPDLFGLVGRMSSPFVLRMWLLSLSYQKPLFFSEENLKMWQHNWDRVQNLMANVQLAREGGQTVDSEVDQAVFDLKTGFTDMVEDDISLYRFWPVLFDFCKMINNRFQKGRLTSGEAALIIENMTKIDTVLRIIDWDKLPLMPGQWPQHVQEKIAERTRAKKNKDYSRADQLRQEIVCAGYQIEDTPFGPRLYLQKA
jgi:cysteinyl-tRNA synthetase